MGQLCRSLIVALTLWLAATALAFAAGSGARPPDDSSASHQQVLVLLRLPPEHFRPNADYTDSYGDGLGRSARRRIASRLARENGLTLATDWPLPLLGVDCFVMKVPADRSPDAVAALLARDPAVAWSEPMNVYHALGHPAGHNDPLFPAQPAAREWRLAELHEIATGRNVWVAVIDSMVEASHPDLAGQVQISGNFVLDQPVAPEQHGTGVAGIIAARADNGLGIAGVAPHARLMALRACWQSPPEPVSASSTICDSLSLAKALHFAITHNAQVINLSLSGPPDPLLGKLLDAALVRGITVVGAFDRNLPGGGFPVSHAGVVGVADEQPGVAIPGVYSAPGRDVPTTQPGGRWFLVSGSSYAAAHVSGLFALVRERETLQRSSLGPSSLGPSSLGRSSLALVTTRPGGGAIDTCATLLRASGPCDCACARVRENSASAQ